VTDAPIVLVVIATPKPDCLEKARQVLVDATPAVHAEDGCLRYAHHVDSTGCLVTVEKWASKRHLDERVARPETARMIAEMEPLLAKPVEVRVLEPVPSGTDELGRL
jgi:quinol monooxygenase YgiN